MYSYQIKSQRLADPSQSRSSLTILGAIVIRFVVIPLDILS